MIGGSLIMLIRLLGRLTGLEASIRQYRRQSSLWRWFAHALDIKTDTIKSTIWRRSAHALLLKTLFSFLSSYFHHLTDYHCHSTREMPYHTLTHSWASQWNSILCETGVRIWCSLNINISFWWWNLERIAFLILFTFNNFCFPKEILSVDMSAGFSCKVPEAVVKSCYEYEGVIMPNPMPIEALKGVRKLACRPDDLFIVTYPKSGSF